MSRIKKVELVKHVFMPASMVEVDGNRHNLIKYLTQGYCVKQVKDGMLTFARPAEVVVVVKDDDGEVSTFYGRDFLRWHYAERSAYKVMRLFMDDAAAGKLKFYLSSNRLVIK